MVLNIDILADLRSDCITFNARKAKIGDKSSPPRGGIIPLNAFKYGSDIELTVDSTVLLQSKFGNQLSKTLLINMKE